MSPAMFFYATAITLLIAGGAAAIEWGTQGRVATRHFWTVAIVLGLIAPATALWWRTAVRRPTTVSTASADQLHSVATVSTSEAASSHATSGASSMGRLMADAEDAVASLENTNPRLDVAATWIWVLLSTAFATWLVAGTFRWRRVRRKWQTTTVDGIRVDVSPFTGPAVLGFLSHRIVLPTWATLMSPEHRRLVLAHECEHIEARDPQRLALGIAALVLMPWNVGLWWCAARLRRAIELDCDARVLQRFPSAKNYGYVLLEVAARGRNTGPLAMPMVALLRLPSELELRLRAITRPRSAGARMIAAGAALAFVAVGAAFSAPVPYARAAALADNVARQATPRPTELYTLTRTGAARDSAISQGQSRGTGRITLIQIEHRAMLDTTPRSRKDTLSQQKRDDDSLKVILTALQEKSAVLGVANATLESLTVVANSAARRYVLSDSGAARLRFARRFDLALVRQTSGFAAARLRKAEMGLVDTEWSRRTAMIEAALVRFYPELVAHPEDGAVIWFVADSSGRVIHTRRDDSFQHHVMSADSVTARFPEVNPSAIATVSIMRKTFGDKTFSVSWTTLKGAAHH